MKSLQDLLGYYKGVRLGAWATSEYHFESGSSRVDIGINHKEMDGSLLYDANRLTKAAVASFLASNRLQSGGHRTWALISLYYAQFHIIAALLRLAGLAPVDKGRRLLLRNDEAYRSYVVLTESEPDAKKVGFRRGGSHQVIWRMFGRTFQDWSDPEPADFASVYSDGQEDNYFGPLVQRNKANYLQSIAGLFFPETDRLEDFTISTAKAMGNWDWLRTDANPMSDEEPPEAWFAEEMMAWNIIKYTTKALVTLEGQDLLEEYIWIIEHLDAHDELRAHMTGDLRSTLVDHL